jgi:hypothetical protein
MAFLPLYNIAQFKNDKDLPKVGKVINNLDPTRQGRIKVAIVGIFDPIDEQGSNLPWVYKLADTSFGGSKEREFFNVPSVGELVEIEWRYDNRYPFYKGCPYTAQSVTGVFQEEETYPNLWGWSDGDFAIIVNKITKDFLIRSKDCAIEGTTEKGIINITAKTEINVTTQQDINVTSTKNVKVKTETANIETTNATVKGDKINISGGAVTISGGQTVIDGKNFLGHRHGNGNDGSPTTGVI